MNTKDLNLLSEAYVKIYESSKKKVNPWAVCGKVKKKGKKERCVKDVKKSAKKYGKKITSDKVVSEEFDEDLMRGSTNMPHGQGYPNVKPEDKEWERVVNWNEEGISYPAYATAYDVTRNYGGPEEGGWWYTAYSTIDSINVKSYQEFENAAKNLYNDYSEDVDGKLLITLEQESGSLEEPAPRYE